MLETDEHRFSRFDENHPARATDPQTSHNAADRIKKNPDIRRFSAKSTQCKLLRLFSRDEYTDTEVALLVMGHNANPGPLQGARRRCSDLRAAGYIEDTVIRRRNDGTLDEAMVSTITDKGRGALQRIAETGWSR